MLSTEESASKDAKKEGEEGGNGCELGGARGDERFPHASEAPAVARCRPEGGREREGGIRESEALRGGGELAVGGSRARHPLVVGGL